MCELSPLPKSLLYLYWWISAMHYVTLQTSQLCHLQRLEKLHWVLNDFSCIELPNQMLSVLHRMKLGFFFKKIQRKSINSQQNWFKIGHNIALCTSWLLIQHTSTSHLTENIYLKEKKSKQYNLSFIYIMDIFIERRTWDSIKDIKGTWTEQQSKQVRQRISWMQLNNTLRTF